MVLCLVLSEGFRFAYSYRYFICLYTADFPLCIVSYIKWDLLVTRCIKPSHLKAEIVTDIKYHLVLFK